jgi:NAD(P)-dependent dehydrogenase (short-subunit alcohol dehydrogenase family)
VIALTAPSFRLDGRSAIVTGAGRGIGFACACALASVGAAVTLVGRTLVELEVAAQAIRESGFSAQALTLDVADLAMVERFFSERPAFDVLINNAGTNRPMGLLDISEQDYDAVMNLNLKSAFFVAQAAAKRLVANKRPGSLIHMSSQMGHVGGKNRSLYCASKWGLEGLNKALALDLAAYQIRSNTIAPTFIETPMTLPFFKDAEFLNATLARIKLGRLGKPQDIMGAVLYLASDAAAMVTGTSVLVDGGWTAD